uniref:Uncharacterized protein n=1 Tax=Arundo donax TaxID=35708 RepID=A0A0A9DX20_ARUDO
MFSTCSFPFSEDIPICKFHSTLN